jgi:hypothetical protein
MVRDVYIRAVQNPDGRRRLNRSGMRNIAWVGCIRNIPKRHIGQPCLVVPLNERQAECFKSSVNQAKNEKLARKRAVRFAEQLLKNPRKMLDGL